MDSRGFEPGLSESVRTKSYRLYPLDDLGKCRQFEFKRGIYSFVMVLDSFQGWLLDVFIFFFFNFRVELNI